MAAFRSKIAMRMPFREERDIVAALLECPKELSC
jgi:hypothetical protein